MLRRRARGHGGARRQRRLPRPEAPPTDVRFGAPVEAPPTDVRFGAPVNPACLAWSGAPHIQREVGHLRCAVAKSEPRLCSGVGRSPAWESGDPGSIAIPRNTCAALAMAV
jgi:hypothetical protein